MLSAEILNQIIAATAMEKKGVAAPNALNEAIEYGSAFSRGMRLDFGNVAVILLSGTASIDEHGKTIHLGDFRGQLRRVFSNVAALLASEGATWKDVVRTTFYFRDIERDYAAFNEERTRFFAEQGIDPFPASTGIEATLCRPDLLIEMEGIAVFHKQQP